MGEERQQSLRSCNMFLLLAIAFLCNAAPTCQSSGNGADAAAAVLQSLDISGYGTGQDGLHAAVTAAAAAAQGHYSSRKLEQAEGEGITLTLTHRDADGSPFRPTAFSSKTALLERLERDQRRVEGINNRVHSLVEGVRINPGRSFEDYLKYDQEAGGSGEKGLGPHKKKKEAVATGNVAGTGFQGKVVSGLFAGSGEYFVTLGFGSPQVKTSMVLDTGSDLLWLQCAPCKSCYNQIGSIFQPRESSSYRRLPCSSNVCQLLQERGCSTTGQCLYQVTYGDGSYTIGDFSTESLTLTGKGGSEYTVQNVPFGCGHDNEGLFTGAAGLLGLGRGTLSFPSQVGRIVGQTFSYCLVDRESTGSSSLIFGASSIPNGTLFTPLLTNPKVKTFYYVGLIGISVGGRKVAMSPSLFAIDASGTGGVIIDSGTSVTRLPSAAYKATRDQFVQLASKALGQPTLSFSIFDTCYDLSKAQTVQVPILNFLFQGGVEVPLPARNYMVQVDSQGTVCFAFAPTSGPLSIIGNIQQMGIRVVHDVQGGRLGFARSQC